ncbi:hypothetical protein LOK49_LG03G01300 [Camellia lanceoleosa]|uniref:Uncharacterized protein n=1 Tax=Camellia lanceoleosa TaxID=1840588 RepID=A0ACC0IAZ8_9ERIC|nr:hypothetical protein LOK49_LG03G01300 [Camellia lanceoleosa]
METCYGVKGLSGQPGCVRYCTTTKNFFMRSEETVTKWGLEKLLTIDSVAWSYSFEILDNYIGFNSFVATTKFLPFGDSYSEGCEMECSFVVDPVEGWRLEDLVVSYDSGIHGMAKRIEKVISTVN